MPATHTEKCRALSTHALTDRLAGKMEMKAYRKLTYAYNTHEDTVYGHLYTHTCAHTALPQSCAAAFLPYFSWSWWMATPRMDFYTLCCCSWHLFWLAGIYTTNVPPPAKWPLSTLNGLWWGRMYLIGLYWHYYCYWYSLLVWLINNFISTLCEKGRLKQT